MSSEQVSDAFLDSAHQAAIKSGFYRTKLGKERKQTASKIGLDPVRGWLSQRHSEAGCEGHWCHDGIAHVDYFGGKGENIYWLRCSGCNARVELS